MKVEIKCVECDDSIESTNVVDSLKAFFNPCECGSKQEVKFIQFTSKGNR